MILIKGQNYRCAVCGRMPTDEEDTVVAPRNGEEEEQNCKCAICGRMLQKEEEEDEEASMHGLQGNGLVGQKELEHELQGNGPVDQKELEHGHQQREDGSTSFHFLEKEDDLLKRRKIETGEEELLPKISTAPGIYHESHRIKTIGTVTLCGNFQWAEEMD